MFRPWILAATGVLGATAVPAQDVHQESRVGQQECLSACAACLVEAADGSSDLATMVKIRVPDLTQIAIRGAEEAARARVLELAL